MITKIIDEQPFQVLTNNFSISPSVTGYELQISADGIDYTTLFTVNANTTRMVTGVAANSYYRLLGNEGEVVVNWQKVCVTGGGGDLSNYYTKSETDAAIEEAIEGISGGTADLYDRYKKVVYNIDDSFDYDIAFFQTSTGGDYPASSVELYTATVPPTSFNAQGSLDYDPYMGEIDRENQTITFYDIPAGTYNMMLYKGESEDSGVTFPVLFGCPNEDYEEFDVATTEDETIEELNRTYNTPYGNDVYVVPNLDTHTWTFIRDVDTFVINYSEGYLQTETDYKPTAEELIGAVLIGSEGSVQDALENAGIFVDGVGIINVVDTFSGITSGLSAELSTVERVTSTAINSLRTDVNTISGATANMVTSAYGSGHNVTGIWQGTQDDYNMLTQSGATADATTFYIIKNNPTE